MIFTEANSPGPLVSLHPSLDKVLAALEQIDPEHKAYFILEDHNQRYIQCAGSRTELTIEYRDQKEAAVLRYVLGRGTVQNPLKMKWVAIQCAVGPIYVQDTEVLSLDDAKVVFKQFLEKGSLPEAYSLRKIQA